MPTPRSAAPSVRVATLLAVLLILHPAARAKQALDPSIYGFSADARRCLDTMYTVALVALRATNASGTPANCLRFAFHDAATFLNATGEGGANGSILYELNATEFPVQNGLQLCGSLIQHITPVVRLLGCPGASAADVIQVTAVAGVVLTSGPVCPMLVGRPDKLSADNTSSIPGSPCDSAAQMVASFAAMGFSNVEDTAVVLLGAHTIGHSRVSPANNCSRGIGFMTAEPNKFDGHYFSEVVNQTGEKGWFFTDRDLAVDPATAPLMAQYAVNHSDWLADWCPKFQELSLLGVDPAAAGYSITDGWVPRTLPLLETPNSPLGKLISLLGTLFVPSSPSLPGVKPTVIKPPAYPGGKPTPRVQALG